MDIKEAAQKVIKEVKSNPELLKKLSTNAESTVKEVLKDGKLTSDEVKKVAEEVIKQLGINESDVMNKVKGLFSGK